MSDFVIMPYKDYKDACESIRSKTGKTELIASGFLKSEIDSIGDSLVLWNAITNNGNRTHCSGMFANYDQAGTTWNFDIITCKN